MYPKITNCIIIIGALIVDFSILNYYTKKKNIPIKNNKLFMKMLQSVIVMSCIDAVTIFACFLKPGESAIRFHAYSNLIYLIAYEISFFYLGEYMYWNAGGKRTCMVSRLGKIIVAAVAVLTGGVVTHFDIYYIDAANRFHFGRDHYLINILPVLLIVFMTINFIVKRRGHMGIRNRGIVSGAVVLLTGVLSDQMMEEIILVDFFFALSTMIFYISAENPEYFRSEKFRCFNNTAFERLVNEEIAEKNAFTVYGIEIRNTETIKSRRGTETFYSAMAEYARWMNRCFPEAYVFYTDNDCFNLLFLRKVSEEMFQSAVEKSMQHTFKSNTGDVNFWVRGVSIDCDSPCLKKASYITRGENYVIQNASYRSGDIKVDEAIYKRVAYEKQVNDILGTCIQEDSLKIYIQPYYGVKTGGIVAGEILTRIVDDTFGVIMPGDFIPLAEKNGFIMELSYAIFEKTCQFIRQYRPGDMGIKFININCSPLQFQDLFLAEKLKAISDRYGVDFSVFNFEVTESFATSNDIMKVHIQKFKSYGAGVAMDDFGKGHSNLSRLRDVNFDIAKLDMSLVWSYFDNQNTFLEEVIEIFRKDGLNIVAEGVETFDMAQSLAQMGCDYLQGYYFSKPIPVETFPAFLRAYQAEQAGKDRVISQNRNVIKKDVYTEKDIYELEETKNRYRRSCLALTKADRRYTRGLAYIGICFWEYNIDTGKYIFGEEARDVTMYTPETFRKAIEENRSDDTSGILFGEMIYLVHREDWEKTKNGLSSLNENCDMEVNLRFLCGDRKYHYFNVKIHMLKNERCTIGCMRLLEEWEKKPYDAPGEVINTPMKGMHNYILACSNIRKMIHQNPYSLDAFVLFHVENFEDVIRILDVKQKDTLIRCLVENIQSIFGKSAVCARVRGDEMFAFMKDVRDREEARQKAEEFIKTVENRQILNDSSEVLKISMGIAYTDRNLYEKCQKEFSAVKPGMDAHTYCAEEAVLRALFEQARSKVLEKEGGRIEKKYE